MSNPIPEPQRSKGNDSVTLAPDEALRIATDGAPEAVEPASQDTNLNGPGTYHPHPQAPHQKQMKAAGVPGPTPTKPAVTQGMGPGPHKVPQGGVSLTQYPFLTPPQKPGDMPSLGEYQIVQVLGKGGMGVVFHGWDPKLRRSVAIKVMRLEIAEVPDARRRFLREARAVAKLHDDHVIKVYEVSDDGETPYIVMPLLKGMTLEAYLKANEGPLPLEQVLRIGREIALGLAAAHAEGVIHRDIKPANLWLDASNNNRVIILDWGLARPAEDGTLKTQDGGMKGTLAYMPPEQTTGKDVDTRADLYSLGAVLYQLATGQRVFPGDSIPQMILDIVQRTPTAPIKVNPDTPPGLSDLVMRLLEKCPQNRPVDAKAVVAALDELKQDPNRTETGRFFPRLQAALVTMALLVGVLYLSWHEAWHWQKESMPRPPFTFSPSIVAWAKGLFNPPEPEPDPVRPPVEPPKPGPGPIPPGKVPDAWEGILTKVKLELSQDQFDNAQKVIDENATQLEPEQLTKLKGMLADKQNVHDLLGKASKFLVEKNFKEALDALGKRNPPFEFPADTSAWDKLSVQAINGEHARLVNDVENAIEKGSMEDVVAAKKTLKEFRKDWDKAPKEPNPEPPGANEIIQRAWKAILEDKFKDGQKEHERLQRLYPAATDDKEKPGADARLLLIIQNPKNAIQVITTIKAEKSATTFTTPDLWKALLKVDERNKVFFKVENLFELLNELPLSQDSEKKQSDATPDGARSKLLARVLKREVNAKECWLPGEKQWSECYKMCAKILDEDGDDWIRALYVEAAVESKSTLVDRDRLIKKLHSAEIWYAVYACALEQRQSSPRDAASKIARMLKNQEQVPIHPEPRIKSSLAILRNAVKSLSRLDETKELKAENWREFSVKDAADARGWLIAILQLQDGAQKQQQLDDLVDLALASARGEFKDLRELNNTADKMEKLLKDAGFGEPAKEQAYYWLARAYRVYDVLENKDIVVNYCDKALDVNKNGKSQWRRLAAQEGSDTTDFAAKYLMDAADVKKLDSAVQYAEKSRNYASRMKELALTTAAELNAKRFDRVRQAALLYKDEEALADGKFLEAVKSVEPFEVPLVIYKLELLRQGSRFCHENNKFVAKTIEEALLSRKLTKEPLPDADKETTLWWQAKHYELTASLYTTLNWYVAMVHKGIHKEEGDFNDKYVPRLNTLMKYTEEARGLRPKNEMDQAQMSYRAGKIYTDLAASDKKNAATYYQKALDEFARIKGPARVMVVLDFQNELEALEKLCKEKLKK